MIVTRPNARRIIAEKYGSEFRPRFTTKTTIGVRPVYQINLGFPTLCWRSLATGKDSAVKIGRLHSGGLIDWDWEP